MRLNRQKGYCWLLHIVAITKRLLLIWDKSGSAIGAKGFPSVTLFVQNTLMYFFIIKLFKTGLESHVYFPNGLLASVLITARHAYGLKMGNYSRRLPELCYIKKYNFSPTEIHMREKKWSSQRPILHQQKQWIRQCFLFIKANENHTGKEYKMRLNIHLRNNYFLKMAVVTYVAFYHFFN